MQTAISYHMGSPAQVRTLLVSIFFTFARPVCAVLHFFCHLVVAFGGYVS